MHLNKRFLWFLVPCGLYLFLSFLYILVIPVGESPDEPGHMRCIEQVAIEQRLPQVVRTVNEFIDWRARENIISDYMCYHMPNYYVLSGQIIRILAAVSDTPLHFEYPAINANYETNPSMFVHEPRQSLWQRNEPITMLGLRVVSSLFGLVMLWGTYVVARRVFPDNEVVALAAATLLAGWPQFVFISRAISNDSLATALAVAVLVVLTNIGRPQRFPFAAFLSSLALLTKLSVAFTVVMVVVVWLLEVLFLDTEKRPYWKAIIISAGFWSLTILIIRLTPVLWQHWQFSTQDFSGNQIAVLRLAYWQQVYAWTMSSGWAWFGWLRVRPPEIHARLWWLLIEMAVVFGAYGSVKQTTSRRHRALLVTLGIWGMAVIISYIRVTSNRWQPQFRFAFALLPLLATFAAGGALYWLRKHPRWQWRTWAIGTVMLGSYNIWLIVGVILPAYGMR